MPSSSNQLGRRLCFYLGDPHLRVSQAYGHRSPSFCLSSAEHVCPSFQRLLTSVSSFPSIQALTFLHVCRRTTWASRCSLAEAMGEGGGGVSAETHSARTTNLPTSGHTLSRSRTWNDDLTHPGALVRLFPGRVLSRAPSSGGSFTRYLPSVEDLPSGFAKWVGDRTLGRGECVLRCQGVRRSRTEESDGQKRAWRPAVERALPNNGL